MDHFYEDEHRYDSIINLPHHVSGTHPQMSALDRAAQFSPFAALTGYDAAVEEAARLTDAEIAQGELQQSEINEKLRLAAEHIRERPVLSVTWFRPDDRKAGGAYVTAQGAVKAISREENRLIFEDGTKIPLDAVSAVAGDLFAHMEW